MDLRIFADFDIPVPNRERIKPTKMKLVGFIRVNF
jgi:hypothetical protein